VAPTCPSVALSSSTKQVDHMAEPCLSRGHRGPSERLAGEDRGRRQSARAPPTSTPERMPESISTVARLPTCDTTAGSGSRKITIDARPHDRGSAPWGRCRSTPHRGARTARWRPVCGHSAGELDRIERVPVARDAAVRARSAVYVFEREPWRVAARPLAQIRDGGDGAAASSFARTSSEYFTAVSSSEMAIGRARECQSAAIGAAKPGALPCLDSADPCYRHTGRRGFLAQRL